jgi:hypothetical protein
VEKDLSIPDQLRQMREWCKGEGLTVAMEYVESGATATDDIGKRTTGVTYVSLAHVVHCFGKGSPPGIVL